jgi:hypothetical protein
MSIRIDCNRISDGFHIYLYILMEHRSNHLLIEMSTRNLPGAKGRPARKAYNLTAICEPIV